MKRILIVEDEVNSLKVLSAALKKEKYEVHTATSGEDALELMKSEEVDLILSDYKLPGITGEDLLDRVKELRPEMPVVLITAYGTIERAVNAMRKGAYTYLTKPVNLSILVNVLRDALRDSRIDLAEEYAGKYQFLNIIGKARPMQEVFSLINRVSKTDANVLILGESGTGKELAARAIHYTSLRSDNPFIPIDCTTIPSELMESELFGYEKGAFTCAYENKVGLIEMAAGGTVFFDEIGDLDVSLQKKLLRFLQEKEFYRLGGKQKITVDVRVLAATNQNIEEAVEKGEFRADLYYRLNVITLNMPALRQRRDDIPMLAEHFLEVFCKKNRKEIKGFDPQAMEALLRYDWPGNVRELENVIERAVILCGTEQICLDDLPRKMRVLEDEAQLDRGDEFNLLEIERRVIQRALDRTGWNQSQAARLLGVSRKQLRTKMKNLGLMSE
jgi:two-component system response regulator HydG/two-component system response regulator AtoC